MARESRQQRDTQSGRDQPHHCGVVVRGIGDLRGVAAALGLMHQVAAAPGTSRDPLLARQVADVHLALPGQGVVLREHHHGRFGQQIRRDQPTLAVGHRVVWEREGQGDIRAACPQQPQRLRRLHLLQRDPQLGMRAAQCRQGGGHERRGGGGKGHEAHDAGTHPGQGRHLGLGGAQHPGDRLPVPGQRGARLGEAHRASLSVQKRRAEPTLETRCLLARRGLADPEGPGGRGDAAVIANGLDQPEPGDVEVCHAPCITQCNDRRDKSVVVQ